LGHFGKLSSSIKAPPNGLSRAMLLSGLGVYLTILNTSSGKDVLAEVGS
jgi:hypothetical protein